MRSVALSCPKPTEPEPVVCACGRTVFDGEVITARVIRLFPRAQAKCRCKAWVDVPIKYSVLDRRNY